MGDRTSAGVIRSVHNSKGQRGNEPCTARHSASKISSSHPWPVTSPPLGEGDMLGERGLLRCPPIAPRGIRRRYDHNDNEFLHNGKQHRNRDQIPRTTRAVEPLTEECRGRTVEGWTPLGLPTNTAQSPLVQPSSNETAIKLHNPTGPAPTTGKGGEVFHRSIIPALCYEEYHLNAASQHCVSSGRAIL